MIQYNNYKSYPKFVDCYRDGQGFNALYTTILNQNHAMIAGKTGSGKSVLIKGLIHTILKGYKQNASVVICDPKLVDFVAYKDLPMVSMYANSDDDILKVFQVMHGEMMKRYNDMQVRREVLTSESDVYIIVDELADLLVNSNHKKELLKLIQSICQLGRAAKIHCILATQSPSRKTLPAEIMVNMNCTVALQCKSDIESRQILGVKGAENLPKHGKCMIQTTDGLFCENVVMYSEEEIAKAINHFLSLKTKASVGETNLKTKRFALINHNLSWSDCFKEATKGMSFMELCKVIGGVIIIILVAINW